MCHFFSAIVVPSGDVLWHWATDSHSVLAEHFGLSDKSDLVRDGIRPAAFAKVELSPVGDNWTDPDNWKWTVDEPVRPEWLTEDMERRARDRMTAIVKGQIVTEGERNCVLDGFWIAAGTSRWSNVRNGRIVAVRGSATISGVGGYATISGVGGSATISGVWGSATIRGVRGSATISDVGESATISGVGDSATISDVGGSATIRDVGGYATISGVGDSATISDVGGSATISGVWGSATIRGVWGSATISGVRDSATISDVGDSATISDDRRTTIGGAS